jgi:LacI family transcriptional regulator
LLNLPKPVGIVGFNEAFSARICARSLDAGLTVPDQVAILSCGDDPLICECTPIQLSSIPALGLKIADATIALLQDLMDGHPSPQSTVFVEPGGIKIRESTDVLATTCPEVALAIRFMWDNLGKGLSVDDIAGAINVPRRKLERAFRQQLGRGINAELLRRRLEYCCELLRSTDHPVIDIVPKIGFSSTAYLYKVFQRKFGMTPVQWRNTHSQDSSSI